MITDATSLRDCSLRCNRIRSCLSLSYRYVIPSYQANTVQVIHNRLHSTYIILQVQDEYARFGCDETVSIKLARKGCPMKQNYFTNIRLLYYTTLKFFFHRQDRSRYDNCILSDASVSVRDFNTVETKRDWTVYQVDKRCRDGSGGSSSNPK